MSAFICKSDAGWVLMAEHIKPLSHDWRTWWEWAKTALDNRVVVEVDTARDRTCDEWRRSTIDGLPVLISAQAQNAILEAARRGTQLEGLRP